MPCTSTQLVNRASSVDSDSSSTTSACTGRSYSASSECAKWLTSEGTAARTSASEPVGADWYKSLKPARSTSVFSIPSRSYPLLLNG